MVAIRQGSNPCRASRTMVRRLERLNMKKMTLKEFKEALSAGSTDFEVFGYEGILNLIQIAQTKLADDSEANGSTILPDYYRRHRDALYNILKERGYYDN